MKEVIEFSKKEPFQAFCLVLLGAMVMTSAFLAIVYPVGIT